MNLEATAGGFEPGNTITQERVRVLPDGRLTRRDAAIYLGLSQKTLAQWQVSGKLKGVRVGGRVFYFLNQLDAVVRGEAA